MMRGPEVTASYTKSLNNLLAVIKKHMELDNPQDVLISFNDMLVNGVPANVTQAGMREIFPALELFKYWMDVNAHISVLNKQTN